jgi:hypothetical protein
MNIAGNLLKAVLEILAEISKSRSFVEIFGDSISLRHCGLGVNVI